MDAGAVVAALDCLDGAGARPILDGGWGIDALVGEQKREHDDLDLVLDVATLVAASDALASLGYALSIDERPVRVVLAAPDDRRIDIHLVTPEGDSLVQQLPGGEGVFRYPMEATNAAGVIGGRAVVGLSAGLQVITHSAYEPDDDDRADLDRLRRATGIALPPPYAAALPDEVTVRAAATADAAAMAVVRNASWRAAYAGLIDQSILDQLDVAAAWRFLGQAAGQTGPRECTLVAGGSGEVVAFAISGRARDAVAPDSVAELALLYAHPTAWGTGAGRALLAEMERRLAALGYEEALLWTLRDNERARGFYEAHGWRADGGGRLEGPEDRQWTSVRYRLALG